MKTQSLMTRTKPVEKTTVSAWSEVGPWGLSGPPNGCTPATLCRTVTECTLYAADFYGKGEALYLATKSRIQNGPAFGPAFNYTDDGCPVRLTLRLEKLGIVL